MPRRKTPDHSYSDSVITQLELSVVSLFSGGREKAPPQQGGKVYSIVCDQLGTPTEAYDEEGQRVWARELDIYGRIGAQG